MEEYSIEDRFVSIEAKIDFLIHHLDPRIQNVSLKEYCLIKGVQPPHFKRKKSYLLLRSSF